MSKEEVLSIINEFVVAKDKLSKQLGYIGYNGLHMTGGKLVPVMKELEITPTFGRSVMIENEAHMRLGFELEGHELYCLCSYEDLAKYGYWESRPEYSRKNTAAVAELTTRIARLEAENKRLKEERGAGE